MFGVEIDSLFASATRVRRGPPRRKGRVTAIEAVQEDQAAFDELFAGD
jgi:hypothetical protein